MERGNFSITNLLPDFTELGNLSSAHGLSALFVLVLLLLTIVFLAFAFQKYRQSKNHIDFYENLLRDLAQEDLATKQRDLTNQAMAHQEYGRLWKEFDETLVRSPDGQRLFNTLDAIHFFNTTTLARGLTENRLLAAVPGFLTAIGVLGTFAGLQMGLGALELSNDVGVDVLRQGIGHMISGASIAFLTSVWGVGTSVTFNFIEKVLERGIRKRIGNLQNRIDYLYPRINAEQSLVTIADFSRSSNETLQGLAEKIGDRLQEALVQATDSIRTGLEDSLNQIMAPAIQSLVENAQTGSQQVLDNLMTRFLDGVGEAGNSQRQLMEAASKDMQTAMGELGQQMSGFLARMDAQTRQAEEAATARQSFLEQQLRDLGDKESERQKQIGEGFQTMLGNLVHHLQEQQNVADARERDRTVQMQSQLEVMVSRSNQAVEIIGEEVIRQLEMQHSRDEARQEAFSSGISQLQASHGSLLERVRELLGHQQQIFESMAGRLDALQQQYAQFAEVNSRAGSEVAKAAHDMHAVSNQMGVLAVNIRQATEILASELQKAASTTVSLAEENQIVGREMGQALEGFRSLRDTMDQVAEKLKTATESADNGFNAVHHHMETLQKTLNNHVSELEEHLARLLSDYADRVQSQTMDRMDHWNVHTNQYTTAMTSAIQSLASVVDEIENKARPVA